jgi:GT2 family glycosyltransferase
MSAPPQRPFISAAFCSRDRSPSLLRALLSVLDQGWPMDRLELVVVDDASTDDTALAVDLLFRGLHARGYRGHKLETQTAPLGAGNARRRSLALASPEADWVLHIDDDAVMRPGALDRLVRAGEADPKSGIIGPRLVYLSRPDLLCMGAQRLHRWSGRYSMSDPAARTECDFLNGTCLLVRGKALREMGPLYDGFVRCHEDVELCLAIQDLGWRNYYCPEAVVYHDVPVGLDARGREYFIYRNKAIIFRRHLRPPQLWTALATHLSAAQAKAYVDAWRKGILGEKAADIAAAFRDAWRDVRGPRPGA